MTATSMTLGTPLSCCEDQNTKIRLGIGELADPRLHWREQATTTSIIYYRRGSLWGRAPGGLELSIVTESERGKGPNRGLVKNLECIVTLAA